MQTLFACVSFTFFSVLFAVSFSPYLQAREASEKMPDLTFSNFFSDGWKFGSWEEPAEEPDQAPRFKLLKIPATVFEREVRMNYSFTNNGDRHSLDEHEWEFEFEMPVSRRFLIEVEPIIVSAFPHNGDDHAGFGDTTLETKTMLMETRNTTLVFMLGARFPTGNKDLELGSGKTTVSPGFGLWRDLGRRFALNSFLGFDIPAGGATDADPDVTVNYGAALTKTLTSKDTPLFGDFTVFVELNGSSNFGSHNAADNAVVMSILPGVRWNVGHGFWLMPGIEFPVTERGEFENRIWFSVLKDL